MKIAIYPGSFDPITYGHIDILERAKKICDKIIVGVLNNIEKTPLFSVEERIDLIKHSINMENVEVLSFDGLLVDFAKKNNAKILIRGLRLVTDFEYELQQAQTNKELYNEIDTIFLMTNLKYSFLSSSNVKQMAKFGANTSPFVSPYVSTKLIEKYGNNTKNMI